MSNKNNKNTLNLNDQNLSKIASQLVEDEFKIFKYIIGILNGQSKLIIINHIAQKTAIITYFVCI